MLKEFLHQIDKKVGQPGAVISHYVPAPTPQNPKGTNYVELTQQRVDEFAGSRALPITTAGVYKVSFRVTHPANNPPVYLGILARFELTIFPGCCAFAVLANTVYYPTARECPIIPEILNLAEYLASKAGYTEIVATDIERDVMKRQSYANAGYKEVHRVVNRRTTNTCFIAIKALPLP